MKSRTIVENYSIHGKINFQIRKPCDFLRFPNPHYKYFEVEEEPEKLDVVVEIGNFSPRHGKCLSIDGRIFLRENYIYLREKNYEVEIGGLENTQAPIIVRVTPKKFLPFKSLFLLGFENFFLRPILDLVALRKGFMLLHGSSVSYRNTAILFLGTSGSCKTTVLIELLKNRNFKFLSDECVFVNENCDVYPFPFNFDSFLVRRKLGKETISIWHRTFIFLNLLRRSKKINSLVGRRSKAKIIYLLERYRYAEGTKVRCEISRVEERRLLEKILHAQKIEYQRLQFPIHIRTFIGISHYNFLELINAYLYAFPSSPISKLWKNYGESLKRFLLCVKEKFIFKFFEPWSREYSKILMHHLRGCVS